MSISLVTLRDLGEVHMTAKEAARAAAEGFKSLNAVSVQLAILLCYLGGIWATGRCTQTWQRVAVPGLAVVALGFFLSKGRGGWLGAAGGLIYLILASGLRTRTLAGLAVTILVAAATYLTMPGFQAEVNRTIWPDRESMERYQAGVGGFDDGARLACWSHEAAAFVETPIFGTGVFHRGMATGIWPHGSHNFFLQMFLETGFCGGMLVLSTFATMWYHAGSVAARAAFEGTALRAALVAAFLGGMTGEYFYGGTVLLTLLLVYAPVGAFDAVFIPPWGHHDESAGLGDDPLLQHRPHAAVALASLQAQTFEDWECLVVDDGSADRPLDVVAALGDPRFRMFRLDANRGRGAARQVALDHAEGEFLGMLDADDWLFPTKLARQVEALNATPAAALVSTGMAVVDRSEQLVGVRCQGRPETNLLGPILRIGCAAGAVWSVAAPHRAGAPRWLRFPTAHERGYRFPDRLPPGPLLSDASRRVVRLSGTRLRGREGIYQATARLACHLLEAPEPISHRELLANCAHRSQGEHLSRGVHGRAGFATRRAAFAAAHARRN